MQRLVLCLLGCALVYAGSIDLHAQQRPILSPRDSVFLSLDTNKLDVNYGRPSMRGRAIMGHLVPWNQVWRTGANQATHLRTNFDMTLGGVPVPRGRYTLWTLPSPTGWKVIVNKQTGQWGTAYDASMDLARLDAKVEQVPTTVDTFTISLLATGKTSGVMKMQWEHTAVSVTFEKNDHIRPLSPNDSAEITMAGKKLSIKYSRPYSRGRVIWGVVVPYDSVWRTGANLATAFTTDANLTMGGISVPKGSYTLYSIPTASSCTLIINKKPGGAQPSYDPKLDLARISMKAEVPSTAVDPFKIWFEPNNASSATLKLGWADRVFTVQVGAE